VHAMRVILDTAPISSLIIIEGEVVIGRVKKVYGWRRDQLNFMNQFFPWLVRLRHPSPLYLLMMLKGMTEIMLIFRRIGADKNT
jgi:hypothetical protein